MAWACRKGHRLGDRFNLLCSPETAVAIIASLSRDFLVDLKEGAEVLLALPRLVVCRPPVLHKFTHVNLRARACPHPTPSFPPPNDGIK